MEVALYTAITILTWMLSSTVLLPFILLLRLCKTFRNMWFSFIYTHVIIPLLAPKMIQNRKRAFRLLEEDLPRKSKSVPLKVLEIGVGQGANFEFYPENTKLTVVDMNPSFQDYFQETIKKYPHIEFDRAVICMAENMLGVEDSSMDVVICTHVMCSVEDVDSVLKEVKRVLKPGGKFLFLEHTAFEKFGWTYLLQQAITPLWKIYFNGCCPNKNIRRSINRAGFYNVSCENFLSSLWLFCRPHIVGVATK